MGLLGKLFGKQHSDQDDLQMDAQGNPETAVSNTEDDMAVSLENFPELQSVIDAAEETEEATAVNIWDINDDAAETPEVPLAAPEEPAFEPKRRTRRPARNKTRILGFQPQDASVANPFDEAEQPVAVSQTIMSMNPTGWLVVIAGPGVGASFPLFTGMTKIGRGLDQTIPLDFGDMAISRDNHAAIAYDPAEHLFYLGHGGKSNIVRLNGKPVLSTEQVKDGDEILIGETTLRLKTFCSPEFNWETTTEGDEDVAIA
ncbi:FHA domain-containing protein [Profundibacter sp.]